MDIEKCRALLCAVEKNNLSEAASELGYTPSGISRMMATLESEMGLKLLIRNRRGITPTRECEDLLPAIREVVRSGDRLEQEVSEIGGAITGDVEIATAYSSYYKLLSGIIRDFGRLYPGIRVGIQEGRSSLLMRGIEDRSLDFCVISKRSGMCEWIPLFDDEMIAWVPDDHPAVSKKKFRIRDFSEEPFITIYPGRETDTSIVFEKHGVVPNTKHTTSDTYAAYSMVEAGLGVTVVNALYADLWHGKVKALPLEPRVSIPIGIAVTKKDSISPAAERFRDFAVVRLQKLTESI